MIYKCICGQEFDNPQKFNHHKLECKIHIESKGFDYNLYVNSIRQKQSTAAKANAEKRKIELQFKKQKKLDSWISAQHTCEKCGKIMTEKYGSGRFCSKSCANTRNHSSNTKCKISEKLKQTSSFFNKHIDEETHKKSSATLHKNKSMRYYQNPKRCKVCNHVIPYDVRYRATCSNECALQISGGFREGSSRSYKYGTYNDIWCDSSYELAFVVYCLEHSIEFQRNADSFIYEINGIQHKYIPDFKIKDTYIEVKGYHTDIVDAKAKSIPKDIKYILLYEQDLKPCIDYCVEKYGKKYWEVLYDKNKPSCNDKKQA